MAQIVGRSLFVLGFAAIFFSVYLFWAWTDGKAPFMDVLQTCWTGLYSIALGCVLSLLRRIHEKLPDKPPSGNSEQQP